MSKSRRRSAEKKLKSEVQHKAHRRNVKSKLKLGLYEHLPESPRKEGAEGER